MPYTPDQHSGGEGNALVNGADLYVTEWSGGETAVLKDGTTTGDFDPTAKLTRGRDVATKTRYEATCKAFVDGNNFQLAALRAGTQVTNLVLNMFSGHKVTMPLAIIKGVPVESGGIEGLQSYSVQFASQGPYSVV